MTPRATRAVESCSERAGFVVVRQRGYHRVLRHADGRQLTFAYHENVRLGSTALRRVARDAGLSLERLLALV